MISGEQDQAKLQSMTRKLRTADVCNAIIITGIRHCVIVSVPISQEFGGWKLILPKHTEHTQTAHVLFEAC